MLKIYGANQPTSLANKILADARSDKDPAFNTWTVQRKTLEGTTVDALVHNGWETGGSFYCYADGSEVTFRWFDGKSDKFGYLHGRLLEQLATHYSQYFTKVVFTDNRSK